MAESIWSAASYDFLVLSDALGALGLAGYDLCERPTEVSSDFLKCDYSVPVSVWNLTEDLSIFSGS